MAARLDMNTQHDSAEPGKTGVRVQRPYSVQDPILFKYLSWAVKESTTFDDWESFSTHVRETLPFNAAVTRERAWSVISSVFRNHELDILAARIWKHYQDDELLDEVANATFLLSVPSAFGRFISTWLTQVPTGSGLPSDLRDSFLLAEPSVRDPLKRLYRNFNALGFLHKSGRNSYVVVARNLSPTAFLLMLLDRFAPQPNTVQFSDILGDPFWFYLGGREEREIRGILISADRAGYLRQEKVDQLDQIVTRLCLGDALSRRVRL